MLTDEAEQPNRNTYFHRLVHVFCPVEIIHELIVLSQCCVTDNGLLPLGPKP